MKRVITVSLCVFAVMAFSLTSFAQDLTISAGTSNSAHYESTAVVLYDQTGNPGSNGAPSQYFPDFLAAGEAADDFVVPPGETWTIDEIFIVGTYSTTGVYDDLDVNFFSDAAGLPGALVDSRLGLTAGVGPVFTVPLAPAVVLTEGTYWLNFMVNMNFTTNGQFFWSTSAAPVINNPYAWRDSTGLFATPCTGMAWNYGASFCGVGGGVDPDLQFAISGTSSTGGGGMFPEVLYYIFDEVGSDSTYNYADPGSGFQWAQVLGGMSMVASGQFDGGLLGTGNSSSTDYVNTGWATDIGTSDWTISLWLNNLHGTTALNYLFGDNTASSWRCYYSGAAGIFGVMLRLAVVGGSDIVVPAVGPGPSVLTFTYDSSVPEVKAYINGVLVVTQPQAGTLTINGAGPFKVGSYSSSSSMPAGSFLDEFRFYNRALDDAEVAATWNISIVPVELTSFSASVDVNDVTLNWETASEINNSGFQVERKSNGEYQAIGFVPGFGTTTEPKAYSFADLNLNPGTYSYRLKQIDYDGTFEYSDPVEVDITVPDVYSLHQNYPNPFNPSTTITFTLAANANVTLRVFDVLGQEVKTLINQDLTAGVHTYDFDAASFNSGVYFYRIEANGNDGTNFTNVKKMILLK